MPDKIYRLDALVGAAPADHFLLGLGLATAIGLLIGVERGWRQREEGEGRRVAGVRTFAILGLLGGIVGLGMGTALQPFALLVGAGAVLALVAGFIAEARIDRTFSATSTIAGVATLLLGSFATLGFMALAAVGAGVMVVILVLRAPLHKALAHVTDAEMKAFARLALVVFVIFPLLPDAAMGPFGAINPRRLWFVVVVVGAISFAGYILTRWQGSRRGMILTALIGATVSSTAVTVDAARRIREKGGGPAEESAVGLASAMMIARVLALVALLAPLALRFVLELLIPALAFAIAAAALQVWVARGAEGEAQPNLQPLNLPLALLFAGSVAVISLASAWAESRFGSGGGALVIALGGVVDVDSAIAAVGGLPPGLLTPNLAALAIAVPVIANTLFKLALLVSIAGVRRAARPAGVLGATALIVAGTITVVAW